MWIAIATVFAVLAAVLTLAWPLAVVPPGHRVAALSSPAVRTVAGTLGTLAISAMLTPLLLAALISGTDTVQFVSSEFGNLSFGM